MARLFTKFLAAFLVAGLLGGCVVLPVGYGGHHHRYWSDQHDGGYRYWDDGSRGWRYRRH